MRSFSITKLATSNMQMKLAPDTRCTYFYLELPWQPMQTKDRSFKFAYYPGSHVTILVLLGCTQLYRVIGNGKVHLI